ncbi:MAG: sulfotransferase, partial [Psychroserpens sp.]|nr:sulfotransferase [Psychroserpens sp.]
VAAHRIAIQDKQIKLIFILRHPTKRTISNYLHKLKSGRAIYSLEDTLRLQPETIVSRSMYKSQLEVYYNYLPFENIKVVVFEDFISNKRECLKDICQFLEVDFEKFSAEVFETHSNKTKIPRSLKLQLMRNRLLIRNNKYRYSKALPIQPSNNYKMPLGHRFIDKVHKWINPLNENNRYAVKPSTLNFLDEYFKNELDGLDDLVRMDILKKWF